MKKIIFSILMLILLYGCECEETDYIMSNCDKEHYGIINLRNDGYANLYLISNNNEYVSIIKPGDNKNIKYKSGDVVFKYYYDIKNRYAYTLTLYDCEYYEIQLTNR